ncbi:MAG TPA: ferredoxin [Oscillospiraceae bacterium]|nr:ferredoxin [Oscillospiraceae bacterium]
MFGKVYVNENRCIGCGFCMDQNPSLFRLGEWHSEYIGPEKAGPEEIALVRHAQALCPAKAIELLILYSDEQAYQIKPAEL